MKVQAATQFDKPEPEPVSRKDFEDALQRTLVSDVLWRVWSEDPEQATAELDRRSKLEWGRTWTFRMLSERGSLPGTAPQGSVYSMWRFSLHFPFCSAGDS